MRIRTGNWERKAMRSRLWNSYSTASTITYSVGCSKCQIHPILKKAGGKGPSPNERNGQVTLSRDRNTSRCESWGPRFLLAIGFYVMKRQGLKGIVRKQT